MKPVDVANKMVEDHFRDAAKMTELEAQNRELVERIKRLEEALSVVVVRCDHLHHSKKHRHQLGDPCPVVELLKQAKEAKP